MSGLNKVQLIGHLGKDPEIRHLENGNTVAQFSIATSEKFKDKSGDVKEKTEWHNIVIWGKLAEVAEKYLRKGGQLYVDGKITYRQWTDKEGAKKTTTEIIASSFIMLDSKSNDDKKNKKAEEESLNTDQVPAPGPEDDLPF